MDPGSLCIVYASFFLSISLCNPNASRSNFAFKSCGLTQRGSFLFHTSSEKRENQKRNKEPSCYSVGRKLILSVLPFCIRLQWGPIAPLAFASFLRLIIDSFCVLLLEVSAHCIFLLCLYVLLITHFRPSKGNVSIFPWTLMMIILCMGL